MIPHGQTAEVHHMSAIAPIDRLILSTCEQHGGMATIQDCIDAAPTFLPNARSLGLHELLPRATRLRDLGCLEQVGDGRYGITDIGLASLQHGVRIAGI